MVKIQVYAQLKEYFPPEFDIGRNLESVEELKRHMSDMKAEAGALLDSCRFAVKDVFVDPAFKLAENDIVVIIPPSSGG